METVGLTHCTMASMGEIPGQGRVGNGGGDFFSSYLETTFVQTHQCLSHLCVHSMCKFIVHVMNPLSYLFVQECLMAGSLQKQRHFRIAAER